MVARPKIDRQVMRAHNRAVVLDAVRRSGPLARTEVARRTSLAKPTVSAIVDELLAEGLVHEVGVGKSTAAGGRPPTYLDFDVTRDAYVGVHIGVDETTVAVADGRGTIVATRSRSSAIGSPTRSLDHVTALLHDALAEAQIAKKTIRHATIVVPGLVDRETGVCVLAPNLGWNDVPVAQAVRRRAAQSGDGVEHAPRLGVRREPARRGTRRRHVRVALRGPGRRQRDRAGRRSS